MATTSENDTKSLPYRYFEQQMIRRVHHYYLSQTIETPDMYSDMIHQISTAGTDSTIHIHLNTPGGNFNTGVQIVNAMQQSEAHVVCSLEGDVASLGTIIFLAADEFVVHDGCMMMFHNYSGGVFGKGHEQIAALTATTEWISDYLRGLYVPFMSPDEFSAMERGEDLYFRAAEIRERLLHMVNVLEKQKADKEAKTDQAAASPRKKPATKRARKSPTRRNTKKA